MAECMERQLQLRETPNEQADCFTFFRGLPHEKPSVYAQGHYIWSDGSEYFGEFHEVLRTRCLTHSTKVA